MLVPYICWNYNAHTEFVFKSQLSILSLSIIYSVCMWASFLFPHSFSVLPFPLALWECVIVMTSFLVFLSFLRIILCCAGFYCAFRFVFLLFCCNVVCSSSNYSNASECKNELKLKRVSRPQRSIQAKFSSLRSKFSSNYNASDSRQSQLHWEKSQKEVVR